MAPATDDADTTPTAETPVWQLMTRAVAKIDPEARLDELARKLAAVEAGAMGVGSSEDLVGVVSERDVVTAVGAGQVATDVSVATVASTDVITCPSTATAAEAGRLMVERGVRHLIVSDGPDDAIEGIVSARDLLEALLPR